MKVFIGVLVLIFSLQSWTKANDISDFEIGGISLKDNIENFLNKSEIKKYKVKMFNSEEYITLQFDGSKFNSKKYDLIEINYKNPKLIVESIAGVRFFKKKQNCFNLQNEIISDLKDMFSKNDEIKFLDKETFIHGADSSGKSTYTRASFVFFDGSKINIDCNIYSEKFLKEFNFDHQVYVAIDSKEFDIFLNSGRAY